MQTFIYCKVTLHLVGFLLTLNYDARNHELKKLKKEFSSRGNDIATYNGKKNSYLHFLTCEICEKK